VQAPPSLQRAAEAAQAALLRPSATAAAAGLFRPVLLPLAAALVDARLAGAGAGAGPAAAASHAAVAVALVTLAELAPHLGGRAGPTRPARVLR